MYLLTCSFSSGEQFPGEDIHDIGLANRLRDKMDLRVDACLDFDLFQ